MNNITREMIPTKNLAIGFYILFIGKNILCYYDQYLSKP